MANNWTKKELEAAVLAYLEMLQKQNDGIPFIKINYYRSLSDQFGRTAKAFEYRMQNISYVLSILGRRYVKGLLPAKNVGNRVATEIESILSNFEGRSINQSVTFQTKVDSLVKEQKQLLLPPDGEKNPIKKKASQSYFERDEKVVTWILINANGQCECCKKDAPFIKEDGNKFLEVHHLRRLADGGSDTISNAVGVCPNCHRELHYGKRKLIILEKLYSSISRLVRE